MRKIFDIIYDYQNSKKDVFFYQYIIQKLYKNLKSDE